MTAQNPNAKYFSDIDTKHSLADYSKYWFKAQFFNAAIDELIAKIKKGERIWSIINEWGFGQYRNLFPITERKGDFFRPNNKDSFMLLHSILDSEMYQHKRFREVFQNEVKHLKNGLVFAEKYDPERHLAHLELELEKYLSKIQTRKQLNSFRDLMAFLNKCNIFSNTDYSDMCNVGRWNRKKQLKILGVKEKEADINQFDLKNTKDIKRCTELYPLAKDYPDLFEGWYKNGKILFEPTYANGLEKKRKEINAKLETKKKTAKKGFKRGAIKIATKLVPEKVGKKVAKLEQTIADMIYRKKQAGRK